MNWSTILETERMGQSEIRGRVRRRAIKFANGGTPGQAHCAAGSSDLLILLTPMWGVTQEPMMGVVQVVGQEYVLQLSCWKTSQIPGASWQVRLDPQRLSPAQILDYGLYLTDQYLLMHPTQKRWTGSQTILSIILLALDIL